MTAFEAFGEYLSIGEVQEKVPIILLSGGPFDGLVCETPRQKDPFEPQAEHSASYKSHGALTYLSDHRIARVYEWVGNASSGAPSGPGACR